MKFFDSSLFGAVIDSVTSPDGTIVQLQEPVRITGFSPDGCGKILTEPVKSEQVETKPYASHYKQGGVQTADVIEKVIGYLDEADDVDGIDAERAGHMLKYFGRAGHKDDLDFDCYKCADWLHRLLTGKFLNEVGVRYE